MSHCSEEGTNCMHSQLSAFITAKHLRMLWSALKGKKQHWFTCYQLKRNFKRKHFKLKIMPFLAGKACGFDPSRIHSQHWAIWLREFPHSFLPLFNLCFECTLQYSGICGFANLLKDFLSISHWLLYQKESIKIAFSPSNRCIPLAVLFVLLEGKQYPFSLWVAEIVMALNRNWQQIWNLIWFSFQNFTSEGWTCEDQLSVISEAC